MEEATRKIEALCLELRMLKDDNYRIREEQLGLEKGLSEAGIVWPSGAGLGSGRPKAFSGGDPAQQRQLEQCHAAARNLQEENRVLREARSRDCPASDASTDAGADDVSEEEYRALQERLARLQQSHLKQLQEARQLKTRSSASATASAANSGMSTPFSTAGGPGGIMAFGSGSGQDMKALQAQYQALLHEQESLRSKVRKLAHSS